jgi:hypothetical protein
MKTKILSLTMLSIMSITSVFAQDRTTVTANNTEISDNLDLRAVASIFGDSKNLDDFESRLNDPKIQISNLDLNGDNKVDYLRVIETVEGNVHLIVIQSVLGRNTFQDIATVEVERDRNNRVQVQVVGDVFMYGDNYIYEPVYAYTPVIYNSFWVSNYRPYYSAWNWDFYPSFYFAWTPFPIVTYQSHINICINNYHHYNYVNYRRCGIVYNNYYYHRRGNGYERQHPNRSFEHRNSGYANRYELDNNRRTQNKVNRNEIAYNGTRNYSNDIGSPRSVRNQNSSRDVRSESSPRSYDGNQRSIESRRNSSPREFSQQRGNSQRGEGNPKGNRRS